MEAIIDIPTMPAILDEITHHVKLNQRARQAADKDKKRWEMAVFAAGGVVASLVDGVPYNSDGMAALAAGEAAEDMLCNMPQEPDDAKYEASVREALSCACKLSESVEDYTEAVEAAAAGLETHRDALVLVALAFVDVDEMDMTEARRLFDAGNEMP